MLRNKNKSKDREKMLEFLEGKFGCLESLHLLTDTDLLKICSAFGRKKYVYFNAKFEWARNELVCTG